jgi:plastocyanin
MTPARHLAAAAVLALSLTACGSGDDGSDGGDAGGSEPAQSAPSTPSDAQVASQEAAGGDAPAGGVTFVDTVKKPAATLAIGADGFARAETTVSVGDVVRVTAGDDGTYGITVNDLPSYTVTTGLDEFFRFEEPGTYAIGEEVSGATATITAD